MASELLPSRKADSRLNACSACRNSKGKRESRRITLKRSSRSAFLTAVTCGILWMLLAVWLHAQDAQFQRTSIQCSFEKSLCGTTGGRLSRIKAVRYQLQLVPRQSWARKRNDACRIPGSHAISAGRRGFLVYHNRSCRQRDAVLEYAGGAAAMAAGRLPEVA